MRVTIFDVGNENVIDLLRSKIIDIVPFIAGVISAYQDLMFMRNVRINFLVSSIGIKNYMGF